MSNNAVLDPRFRGDDRYVCFRSFPFYFHTSPRKRESRPRCRIMPFWIPAFAGMTGMFVSAHSRFISTHPRASGNPDRDVLRFTTKFFPEPLTRMLLGI